MQGFAKRCTWLMLPIGVMLLFLLTYLPVYVMKFTAMGCRNRAGQGCCRPTKLIYEIKVVFLLRMSFQVMRLHTVNIRFGKLLLVVLIISLSASAGQRQGDTSTLGNYGRISRLRSSVLVRMATSGYLLGVTLRSAWGRSAREGLRRHALMLFCVKVLLMSWVGVSIRLVATFGLRATLLMTQKGGYPCVLLMLNALLGG